MNEHPSSWGRAPILWGRAPINGGEHPFYGGAHPFLRGALLLPEHIRRQAVEAKEIGLFRVVLDETDNAGAGFGPCGVAGLLRKPELDCSSG